MTILGFIVLVLVIVVSIVVAIVEGKAYFKRYKAAQLRDQTQAYINAKILAILEAEYPDVPAPEIDYDENCNC